MSKEKMNRSKCRIYGLPEAYADLMTSVRSKDQALDRIKKYKEGLGWSSTMVDTDHGGKSVGNAAMMYDKIGRCLKCGKLTHKYWAVCEECANCPMEKE